VYTEEEIKYWQ
jgi:hypothetical protein